MLACPMLLALHAGRAARRESSSTSAEVGVQPGAASAAGAARISTKPPADFEAEAVEATLGYLRNIFGASNVPTPLQTVVTRWHEDPHSLGVYSHLAEVLGQQLATGHHRCA